MQCLHPHNLSQAILDRCKTSCALKEQHYADQTSGKQKFNNQSPDADQTSGKQKFNNQSPEEYL